MQTGSTPASLVGEAPAAHPLRDALRARAVAASVPLHVTLELTQQCNLRCKHCYVVGANAGLSLGRIRTLLTELADAKCLLVTLTGGEVATRGDWLDVAKAVRDAGMLVTVLTNATLLSGEDLDALAAISPAHVGVSIYGPTAAVHDAVTGVAGSFDRALGAIRGLVSRGVPCRIGSVLLDSNADCAWEVADLAADLGCEFMLDPTVQPRANGSLDTLKYRVHGDALRSVVEQGWARLGDGLSPAGGQPGASPRMRVPGNCGAGRTSAFITADGRVHPCMGFEPAFGDVSDSSFAEVWRGRTAERFRSVAGQPLSACLECDLLQHCSIRCPRMAAVEDGHMSGISSRACELAGLIWQTRAVGCQTGS